MPVVFVSFDWDHDRHYRFLLNAWDANPLFRLSFTDGTPSEIQSADVGRVKAAITKKVNDATHTLVIIGAQASTRHRDAAAIGYTNWISFEIAQSKAARNKIVAVKLDRSYTSPLELAGANASWAMAFTENAVVRALQQV